MGPVREKALVGTRGLKIKRCRTEEFAAAHRAEHVALSFWGFVEVASLIRYGEPWDKNALFFMDEACLHVPP